MYLYNNARPSYIYNWLTFFEGNPGPWVPTKNLNFFFQKFIYLVNLISGPEPSVYVLREEVRTITSVEITKTTRSPEVGNIS